MHSETTICEALVVAAGLAVEMSDALCSSLNSLHGGPCGFHHRGGGFGKFWPLLHVFAGLQVGNGSKRISVAIMIHTWPCHRLALSCNSCDSMAQAYASLRDSYCSNFFFFVCWIVKPITPKGLVSWAQLSWRKDWIPVPNDKRKKKKKTLGSEISLDPGPASVNTPIQTLV